VSVKKELISSFRAKKQQKEFDAVRKREEIYRKIPEVLEIEEEISSIWVKNAKAIVEGKGKSIDSIKKAVGALDQRKEKLLLENGYKISDMEPDYDCKICSDTGFVDAGECICFKKALVMENYKRSNLGSLIENESFDNFDFSYYSKEKSKEEGISPRKNIESIFSACLSFVKNFPSGENLLLYGSPGLGKTFLSTAISKELLDKGYDVFYQSAYRIFNLFEDYRFNRTDSEEAKEQIDRVFASDLFIIDDLGTEASSVYTNATLFDIISTRLINKKSTIINTNLNISELSRLYSERFVSRIMGNFQRFKFFGDDIRIIKNS